MLFSFVDSLPSQNDGTTTKTLRSRVSGALVAWFSSGGADWRTPEMLERDAHVCFLLPSLGPYQRWMCVAPAIVTQMVLGSFYSTSVFNKINDTTTWGEPGVNARMFVACVACYGAGTLALGNWVGRNGVVRAVSCAAFLTPAGWACAGAALVYKQQALLYAYGMLHGIGCALCYISTTSALAAWYPESKGFMAGVAVFGAGLGSYVWTLVARALMDPIGYAFTPTQVIFTFSLIFAILLLIMLPFLRNPPGVQNSPTPLPSTPGARALAEGGSTPAPPDSTSGLCSRRGPSAAQARSASPDRAYTFLQAFTSREFFLTAAIVFGTSLPGVVFLSSAADMASNLFGLDTQAAALITSYLNLVNFLGRFVWGAVTDVIGRKAFWLLSGVLQTAALAIMVVAVRTGSYNAWLASFLTIGSLYGGGFGVLPAFVAEIWGSKISSATHGASIAFWAVACIIGTPIFASVNAAHAKISADGHKVPSREGYAINATWLAVLPSVAFIATLLLNVRREDRVVATATKSVRVRFGWWVLAFDQGCRRWPRLLNLKAQAGEYKIYDEDEGKGEGEDKVVVLLEGPVSPASSAATNDPGLIEWGVRAPARTSQLLY